MNQKSTDLLSRLQAGEMQALLELELLYFDRCYLLMRQRYAILLEDFEDVFSEALLALWPKVGQFAHTGALCNYFFKLVQGRCYDRAQRTFKVVPLPAEDVADGAPYYPLGLQALEKAYLIEQLHAAIEELPFGQRAVMLRTVRGESIGEIAAALGIESSTVRAQKANALKALRKRLAYLDLPGDLLPFSALPFLWWLLLVVFFSKKS